MESIESVSTVLSLFNHHLHPVFGVDRDLNSVVYVNAKAESIFSISERMLPVPFSDYMKDLKVIGSEEFILNKQGRFKVHRLETNSFPVTVVFFEPLEEEPGKKVIETGELAASLVAHLFRSPLTALIGLADMVTSSTDQNKEMIAKALQDGLQRIGGFVDKLDAFSHEMKPDFQKVNLGVLVQAYLYELPAKERQNVRFIPKSDSTDINSDPQFIKQIITELITNAFEFGADELSPIEIHQKSASSLWVGNMGTITKDIESGLFQPFFSTKSQNWGIGLSKALKLAHALGGTLRLIENSRINGIIFELELKH